MQNHCGISQLQPGHHPSKDPLYFHISVIIFPSRNNSHQRPHSAHCITVFAECTRYGQEHILSQFPSKSQTLIGPLISSGIILFTRRALVRILWNYLPGGVYRTYCRSDPHHMLCWYFLELDFWQEERIFKCQSDLFACGNNFGWNCDGLLIGYSSERTGSIVAVIIYGMQENFRRFANSSFQLSIIFFWVNNKNSPTGSESLVHMFTQLILTVLFWPSITYESGNGAHFVLETILNKTKDFYADKPRTRSGWLLFYFNNPVTETCLTEMLLANLLQTHNRRLCDHRESYILIHRFSAFLPLLPIDKIAITYTTFVTDIIIYSDFPQPHTLCACSHRLTKC